MNLSSDTTDIWNPQCTALNMDGELNRERRKRQGAVVEKEKSLQLDEDTCFLEWKNIDDAPMRECAAYTVKI